MSQAAFIAQYLPGCFRGKELERMPHDRRLRWYQEARRARDRQLSDMAQAATIPYTSDEARDKFYESLDARLKLYSSEKADAKRAHDAECARNLAELFGRKT